MVFFVQGLFSRHQLFGSIAAQLSFSKSLSSHCFLKPFRNPPIDNHAVASASFERPCSMGSNFWEKGGASQGPYHKTRVKPWKLVLLGAAILVAIALSIGLGVGLTNGSSPGRASSPPSSDVASDYTSTNTTNSSYWSPTTCTSWQIELAHPLTNTTFNASVYDLDIFDNNATTITNLHNRGRKVICYFSAGSYENWRPDAASFNNKIDLGKPLDG